MQIISEKWKKRLFILKIRKLNDFGQKTWLDTIRNRNGVKVFGFVKSNRKFASQNIIKLNQIKA